jgi:TonB family protein
MSLGLAALVLAASFSFAMASELQPTPRPAQAEADRLLADAGIDGATQPISVRARIDPAGKVTGVNVLKSSGSRTTDWAVEAVLRRVILAHPPLGLTDGSVTLNVGPGVEQAAR